jgi:hypothetical protein
VKHNFESLQKAIKERREIGKEPMKNGVIWIDDVKIKVKYGKYKIIDDEDVEEWQ